jgi:hypothetical protein
VTDYPDEVAAWLLENGVSPDDLLYDIKMSRY